jgi:hypothetical protein
MGIDIFVTVGPTADMDAAERGARNLLWAKGWNGNNIQRTKTPYRGW